MVNPEDIKTIHAAVLRTVPPQDVQTVNAAFNVGLHFLGVFERIAVAFEQIAAKTGK